MLRWTSRSGDTHIGGWPLERWGVALGLLAVGCAGGTGDLPITSVRRTDAGTVVVNSVCADQVTASWEVRAGVPVVRVQGNGRGGDCGSSVELTDPAFVGADQLRDATNGQLHRIRTEPQGLDAPGG